MRSDVHRELKSGPFAIREARKVGMTWDSLQSSSWRRLSRGQYAWVGLRHDVDLRLRGVDQRLPPRSAFSGCTAAWILGLDLPPEPIEVTILRDLSIRARAGVRVRRARLCDDEIEVRRGFRITAPLRTVCDLGSRKDLLESTVAIDMALHSGLMTCPTLGGHIERHAGAKGIKRLRRAFELADERSESPMETRLRLQLVRAGLPRPEVQAELRDSARRFVGRADLYYPDVRLVIEFDGQNHRERLGSDMRRQNAIVNAGYHILRFTAADVLEGGSAPAHVRKARAALRRNAS